MQISGLVSGMDIDGMVDKLMKAERMPLKKMNQNQTTMDWKRDAFRDVNKTLTELDGKMHNMKSNDTYNAKSISSSQESAVTATGSTSAQQGAYNIKVEELATKATRMSTKAIDESSEDGQELESGVNGIKDISGDTVLRGENNDIKEVEFTTFNEKGERTGNEAGGETDKNPSYVYKIGDGDTLDDVLTKITNDDNHVRAFFDDNSKKVIMEADRTGKYNPDDKGNEIKFIDGNTSSNEFLKALHLDGAEKGGKDAEFQYNDNTMNSHENSYDLGGVTFNFHDTTTGNGANVTVVNDVEKSFDTIMDFVDKYNDVVEKLDGAQKEEKFRDYPPLTDEQKKEMSEHEIELWEDKAKSGILHGESVISQGLTSMRGSWYANEDTGGAYNTITEIGISTTKNYMDGGKLEVDGQELKEALAKDPDSVSKVFSNSSGGEDGNGVIDRLQGALDSTIGQIEHRAGKATDTPDNYSIGKRMKDLNQQIDDFEDRMTRVEKRYRSQFTQMEQAIQRMNQQSSMLSQKFGGGGGNAMM